MDEVKGIKNDIFIVPRNPVLGILDKMSPENVIYFMTKHPY